MKKTIACFIFYFLCGECFSQAGEWVWINGSSLQNYQGNFGVQGVPGPANSPPALYEGCEWTDLNGNFWMFGGMRIQFSSTVCYGDLWKYDPLTNEWTWMKGSGIVNDTGNYGVQGISSPGNNPNSRLYGPASWVDNQGNLWMYGGFYSGCFSDLWKYDILTNEWTWMKGPNITNQPGVYGTQGVPSPSNNPPGRSEIPSAWTDDAGSLWLFGGYGDGMYNDLWKYDISTNEWAWMKGDSTGNAAGVFGTTGIEDPGNKPRGTAVHCRWKDNNGKLWMYGGIYVDGYIAYPDFWRFNPLTNNWAFMGGDSVKHTGTKCVVSSLNSPGARWENRAAWKDQHGDFWFFGGNNKAIDKLNDLWKYCGASNQWVWVKGNNFSNAAGDWGTMGVSSPANKPGGRGGSLGWTGADGHLYLFGGYGVLGGNGGKIYNDLWKFNIDTTCGVCPAPNSIEENNFINELLVFPNPANSSFAISFSSAGRQAAELRIYNTLGKRVYFSEEESAAGKFEKEINVEKWSSGIYFLSVWISSERAKTGGRILSRKIAVSR